MSLLRGRQATRSPRGSTPSPTAERSGATSMPTSPRRCTRRSLRDASGCQSGASAGQRAVLPVLHAVDSGMQSGKSIVASYLSAKWNCHCGTFKAEPRAAAGVLVPGAAPFLGGFTQLQGMDAQQGHLDCRHLPRRCTIPELNTDFDVYRAGTLLEMVRGESGRWCSIAPALQLFSI